MADNVIEPSEMAFCKKMFRECGYKDLLIDEMISLTRTVVDDTEEWEVFLEKAQAFRLNLTDL